MEIKIGLNKLKPVSAKVEGGKEIINGEVFYKITNHDLMRPFLMSIVSDSDHWMFISSNGSLTAGRKNSNFALFPYDTDDKIADTVEVTGSKTIIIAQKNGEHYLWEPFSNSYKGIYSIRRNLYKSVYSDVIRFEEINEDLGIQFKYTWYHGEQFGFIKHTEVTNTSGDEIVLNILDGLQHIIPSGVSQQMQELRSNLVNAYKKNELIKESGLSVFSLSANIVDRPEPSESLRASIAWSAGIDNPIRIISSTQLDNFRRGEGLEEEIDVRAERGAYFVNHQVALEPEGKKDWCIGADVNKSTTEVADFSDLLRGSKNLIDLIWADIQEGKAKLKYIIISSDGLQVSNDHLSSSRHTSNVLFNVMRGGILDSGYLIDRLDFEKYIATSNQAASDKFESYVKALPVTLLLSDLMEWAKATNHPDLIRYSYEYLPLYFSRRHGDPSRPWNVFSINTKAADGSKVLNYEGNWRDIFQNWEALAISYPEFVESMVVKFLNASTADGYNPYRITRNGIDWEVVEPHDPWSFIGYWGDHQIIYLLKLLESSAHYHPGKLQKMFDEKIFSFANVPYRIKKFDQLVADPRDTISYDTDLAAIIDERVKKAGADGKLIWNKASEVHKVNLLEKLLIPLLAKLSNFVPDGGIWLNTQRPEWNDANNALVGNGVSMVTLYYMRRYVSFLMGVLSSAADKFSISSELLEWHEAIADVFQNNIALLKREISDKDRKSIVQALGLAAQNYNQKVYKGHSEKAEEISVEALLRFLDNTLTFLEHSINANRREDHLYHAYNLLSFTNDECSIEHLHEMLEGQVAVLSAGYVSGKEALSILDAMKESALFRDDQYSYLLYPNRDLGRFLEKNTVSELEVKNVSVLMNMVDVNDFSIMERDEAGHYHFNSNFKNAKDLREQLDKLEQSVELNDNDIEAILALYEKVFNHKQFTGRSGTFFGYEGLNSIYWHMVSKLLLAVQENIYWSIDAPENQNVIDQLIQHYFEIRAGIGLNKSPELYGAFPTDPYSHTPANKGAQQPGMTGQVKEDIICRFGELGVQVRNGCITFREDLLRRSEFLDLPKQFQYKGNDGRDIELNIEKGSLCFTICQIPVVYTLAGEKKGFQVEFEDSAQEIFEGLVINAEISKRIFNRDPLIRAVHVQLEPRLN